MHPVIKAIAKGGVNVLRKAFALLPVRKMIVFESNPDFACNTYPVFLQLKKALPNYKMVWGVTGGTEKPENVDAVFELESHHIFSRLKELYYLGSAKAVVSCNRILAKTRPEQVNVFLCHGSKTKKTRGLYEVGQQVDYINVQAHFFDDIITYEYNCEKSQLVYLGYPRCDCFFDANNIAGDVKRKMGLPFACRYLVWLPTFRKHRDLQDTKQMDAQKYSSLGMPLVYSPEDLQKLNAFLAENGLCILYKPHPAQDVRFLKAAGLSHIHIICDQDLEDRELQLYEVLAGSAGLITDYSSVYFDYLLLDRPIATTTDDIEEWKKMTGFAFDLDAVYDRSTTRCPDLNALITFLSDLDGHAQAKAAGREEIRNLTNIWYDGNSAKRVADFIKEKIGE